MHTGEGLLDVHDYLQIVQRHAPLTIGSGAGIPWEERAEGGLLRSVLVSSIRKISD